MSGRSAVPYYLSAICTRLHLSRLRTLRQPALPSGYISMEIGRNRNNSYPSTVIVHSMLFDPFFSSPLCISIFPDFCVKHLSYRERVAPPCTSLYTKAIGTYCCYGFLENENFRQNENLCIFCSKEDLSRRLVCEVTKDMLSPPPVDSIPRTACKYCRRNRVEWGGVTGV